MLFPPALHTALPGSNPQQPQALRIIERDNEHLLTQSEDLPVALIAQQTKTERG